MGVGPGPEPTGDGTSGPPSRLADRVQDLGSFRLPEGFRGRSVLVVQFWWIVQATLFALSPQVLYGWRNVLLRLFGAQVGAGVIVRPSARVTYPWKVSIGDRSWIGDGVELYSLGPIEIGKDAVISQRSYLCTGSHDMTRPSFDIYAEPIVVEDEAWVCSDVFVHPGVTVARGSVVAARSVLRASTTPYDIYAGYPAKRVGSRLDRIRAAAGAALRPPVAPGPARRDGTT